jgi:hypothetical protein
MNMIDYIDRDSYDHSADGLRAVCAEIGKLTTANFAAVDTTEVAAVQNKATEVVPITADESVLTVDRRKEEFARAVEIALTLSPEAEAQLRVRRDPLKGAPFHPPRLSQ